MEGTLGTIVFLPFFFFVFLLHFQNAEDFPAFIEILILYYSCTLPFDDVLLYLFIYLFILLLQFNETFSISNENNLLMKIIYLLLFWFGYVSYKIKKMIPCWQPNCTQISPSDLTHVGRPILDSNSSFYMPLSVWAGDPSFIPFWVVRHS